MLKFIGRCLIFLILSIDHLKKIEVVDLKQISISNYSTSQDLFYFVYSIVLISLLFLAFLEVKSCVCLVLLEVILKTFQEPLSEKIVLNLILISSLIAYYAKISSIKPLEPRRHSFK